MKLPHVTTIEGFRFVIQDMESPIVTVRAIVNAGSIHDEVPGTAHFLEHMFFKGSQRRRGQELNRFIATIGSANAETDRRKTIFYIDTTGPELLPAFDTLCEVLFLPAFDPEELENERTVILQEWQHAQDEPFHYFYQEANKQLFTGALGQPVIGDSESIKKMRVDDLCAFRDEHYNLRNITFLIVGDTSQFTAEAARKILKQYGEVPVGQLSISEYEYPFQAEETWLAQRRFDIQHSAEQAIVCMWMPGWPMLRDIADGYGPEILLNLLAGGAHGLLFDRIREQLGLAYAVGAWIDAVEDAATTVFYALVDPKNVAQCEAEMMGVVNKLPELATDELIEVSRRNFLFNVASDAQTPADVARHFFHNYQYLRSGIPADQMGYDALLAGVARHAPLLRHRIHGEYRDFLRSNLIIGRLNAAKKG